MVVVGEDCALTSKDKTAGRRGLCGTVLIHKVLCNPNGSLARGAGGASGAGWVLARAASVTRLDLGKSSLSLQFYLPESII